MGTSRKTAKSLIGVENNSMGRTIQDSSGQVPWRRSPWALALVLSLIPGLGHGCGEDAPTPTPPVDTDVPEVEATDDSTHEVETQLTSVPVAVTVHLDGEPTAEVLVMQGGNPTQWTTGADGTVTVQVDTAVPGDLYVMGSHPEARVTGKSIVPGQSTAVTIELVRYDPVDNEDYTFRDPGVPWDSHVIEKCSHCHNNIADGWYDSAHRHSTTNPLLQDVYAGTASSVTSEVDCAQRGGTWKEGIDPANGEAADRCFVADGAKSSPGFGACADCHAPGRLPGQESSFRGLFTHGHVRSGVIVTKAALRRIPCPE